MKIHNIATNQTEVTFHDGTQVFYSYRTPVAAFIPGRGFCRTEAKFSVTTSKHINQWLEKIEAQRIPQEEIEELARTR